VIAAKGRPGARWLLDAVRWAWRTKIRSGIKLDLRTRHFEKAEGDAVKVFASNLKDLLLAAPAGGLATLGLDPGYRNGVKAAVVDHTGKFVAVESNYRTCRSAAGSRRWRPSAACAACTGSSSSPSATARPRARPASWPPRSLPRTPS
jgi:uncharacterized protein